ncbi:MAG: hypothetical protein IJT68_04375 [Lentisphaeria bacterium]|nr:hypothetical protein [Lentisphaeria bacterium]
MNNTCDQCQKIIQRDKEIWEIILKLYCEECLRTNNQLETARLKNQEKAYWCRSEKDIPQKLFSDPKQRLVARFVKSYLNTSWHKIQSKEKTKQEKWFDSPDIANKIRSISDDKDKLSLFSKKGLSLLEDVELKDYGSNQFQEDNFDVLSKAVDSEFEKCRNNTKLPKSQTVSSYEMTIIEQTNEPYQTILKMQKVLPGYGIALTCDFLKESHLWNIAKPDVHLCHVFSVIDRIKYSMDLVLVKRIAEFAENVGLRPDPNNFCNTGSYYIDKIIWMLCSRSKTEEDDNEMSSVKGELLSRIASI